MARRSRDNNWIWPLVQATALVGVLGFIFPPFREAVTAVGSVFRLLLIVALAALVVSAICGSLSPDRAPRQAAMESSVPAVPVLCNASPRISGPDPATSRTPDPLMEQLRSLGWLQFERVVALIYHKQGYGVTRHGGMNARKGIDLVIDKEGTRTGVQCGHWRKHSVGVKAVREFLAALAGTGIGGGLFITPGGFTRDAKQLADRHGIGLLNETDLLHMIEATDAKLDPVVLEILRDTREICPRCEREMVLRTPVEGRGRRFWSCSGYPECRFTMSFPDRSPSLRKAGHETESKSSPAEEQRPDAVRGTPAPA